MSLCIDPGVKRAKGLPGALVDPAELQRRVAASEADFERDLAKQPAGDSR